MNAASLSSAHTYILYLYLLMKNWKNAENKFKNRYQEAFISYTQPPVGA